MPKYRVTLMLKDMDFEVDAKDEMEARDEAIDRFVEASHLAIVGKRSEPMRRTG